MTSERTRSVALSLPPAAQLGINKGLACVARDLQFPSHGPTLKTSNERGPGDVGASRGMAQED